MFVGHYAAALAARAVEPRAPLWVCIGAAQLLDIGWGVLVATGVERVSVEPALPGSALVLEHMPWTHSLPAALLWSAAAALVVIALLPPRAVALVVGAVVFSHWLTDLLVHRPDLLLWPGGPKLGFGLWNLPVLEQAVEIGMLALAAIAWTARRGHENRPAWPVAAFVAFLLAVQVAAMFAGGSGEPIGLGLSALAVYLVVTAIAWLTERRPAPAQSRP